MATNETGGADSSCPDGVAGTATGAGTEQSSSQSERAQSRDEVLDESDRLNRAGLSEPQSTGSLVFVTQQFPPDKSGHASRLSETSTSLSAEGWDVTVLAPPPSFPHGEFERSWQRIKQSQVEGVTVNRLWAWQPTEPDPGFLSRLSYYVVFAVHAALWLLLHRREHDVVITTTPPITTGIAGLLWGLSGRQWVVDVRDLWIDASISLGFISEGGLLERFSRRFQRRVLQTADRIAVTTETLGEELCTQYGDGLSAKLLHVPNGVTIQESRSTTDGGKNIDTAEGTGTASNDARSSPDSDDEQPWIAIYTGNIGHAQDLGLCIEALRSLPERVTLRLVGGGDALPELEELTEQLGLDHRVEFHGPVPHEEVPPMLDDARVGLAPLKDDPELAYAMPSKVYEYLGHGLPVVTTGRGELERFVDASDGGIHAENDAESIARAIRTLFDDEQRRREAGSRGNQYVRERYDRTGIAHRFSEELDVLVGSQGDQA
jgi:colanic acid biosynthesis glycosyl transferase WcaI